MSASNQVMTQPQVVDGAIMEKVVLGNDLAGLTPVEKVKYINGVCQTMGLNPATNPIKLMKFNGKEIPYCSKDATEQLRKINHVSIANLETKVVEGVYIVTAHASTPDGRIDSSTGVISMKGLSGDALANAMMKAETKAKRRVTLSICGLGFMDESEADSLRDSKKVNLELHQKAAVNQKMLTQQMNEEKDELDLDFMDYIGSINRSQNEEQLKVVFDEIKKANYKSRPDLFKKLIDAKDERKMTLMADKMKKDQEESINSETGEVI